MSEKTIKKEFNGLTETTDRTTLYNLTIYTDGTRVIERADKQPLTKDVLNFGENAVYYVNKDTGEVLIGGLHRSYTRNFNPDEKIVK